MHMQRKKRIVSLTPNWTLVLVINGDKGMLCWLLKHFHYYLEKNEKANSNLKQVLDLMLTWQYKLHLLPPISYKSYLLSFLCYSPSFILFLDSSSLYYFNFFFGINFVKGEKHINLAWPKRQPMQPL